MSKKYGLNIVQGCTAGKSIEQALNLRAGEVLVHGDNLSCGPLPALRSIEEWQGIREEYLRSSVGSKSESCCDRLDTDLLTNAKLLAEAECITLWLGTGLSDQMFLVWMPQLLRLLSVDPKKLQVIQFYQVDDWEIQCVGLLDADKIASHPEPEILDEATLANLDEAWSALTGSDPLVLERFIKKRPVHSTFLQRSLAYLLVRYPEASFGLNWWDLSLLQDVARYAPDAGKVMGLTLGRNCNGLDYVDVPYLFARLRRLADPSLPYPLLSLIGSYDKFRDAQVELTETGKAVLNSGANFVELNGIDDWVCGVHLDSAAGRVWFLQNWTLTAVMDGESKPPTPTDLVQ